MPPEDNRDGEGQQKDASAQGSQSDGDKSHPATEWDGKRLAAEKVPAEWGDGQPNNKFRPDGDGNPKLQKEGWRWENPNYQGDGVRVDKGNPESSYPSQREDHVIVRSGGNVLGADGKPIKGGIRDDAENAHIPLKDWLKWGDWNNP